MKSLRFRSWKDFSLGWWNALAAAWFPDVRHFENLTPWIQLRLGLRDRVWKPTNGHSRKLAQLSMTIFSKFWSRGHYPICIHGSRSRCFTCIAEQVTSEVVDMFSRGGRDCHFANTSVEMAKFVRAAVQLLRQCFINPWIQTALLWIATVWGCIYPTKLRCPNIAHDPRCLKMCQNISIVDPAAITRWPL